MSNPHGVRSNCLTLLSFALGLLTAATATFGQPGMRQRVDRQLQRPEEPPGGSPRGGPAANPAADAPDEDLKQIKAAKTADELLELGKTFAVAQKQAATEKAIEAALVKKPELIEDTQKQSPKAWNDIWFGHRAKIREKRLKPNDAAGRVKLAQWLYDAGFGSQARTMLSTAITLDKNLPEAKELATKWNISSGGPIQFDLTLGLKEALLTDAINDENQKLAPKGKERQYLILPIALNPAGLRLMLAKGDIKVTSEDGKTCAIVGIALLERSDSNSAPGAGPLADRGKIPDLKMQAAGEPLWESLQIDAAKEGQPQEIQAKNPAHPIVRAKPGGPNAAPPPQPPNPGMQTVKKSLTGYAAYVVDVPENFTTVECAYKGDVTMTLPSDLLGVLNKETEKSTPAERAKMVGTLAPHAASKSAPVAIATLRKLGAIRSAGETAQGVRSSASLKSSPLNEAIDKILVAAFGHESPLVRRTAFDVLSGQDSEGVHILISKATDVKQLKGILGELRAYFMDLRESTSASEAAADSGAPASADPAANSAFARLALAPGVESILFGCLNNRQDVIGEQAVEICLANPGEQTIDLLKFTTDSMVTKLLARVAQTKDAKLQTAVFRTLLRRPENKKMLPAILAAFKDQPLTIADDADPILEVALTATSPDVQRPVLELLAKADLTAVGNSEKFKKLIETLSAGDVNRDPAVRAATLELGRAQLKGAYEAPIKRANQPSAQNNVGIETLVASVAAGANTDGPKAAAAAAALLNLGHVQVLQDRLQRLAPEKLDERLQQLIQSLSREKSLAGRESLTVFLAMQLNSQTARTLSLALSALSKVEKETDSKERWRFNLALKQAVDAKRLASLSVNPDEQIASRALELLRDLTRMSRTEEAEFQALTDEAGRQNWLVTNDTSQAEKAVGPFACMVYLDVRPARAGEPGKSAEQERSSIPLPSEQVRYQRSAQGGGIRVMLGSLQIGPPESDQKGQTSPGMVRINAAPLLRAAMESPEAKKEGVAGKINPLSLRSEQLCELKYEQSGTWSGEFSIREEGGVTPAPEFTLIPVGAKIVFEPVTK